MFCKDCLHYVVCEAYMMTVTFEVDDGICRTFTPRDKWAELNQGYWENANSRPKTYIRRCSACGKEAYYCGRGCSYKFCPNCGARMDGEPV